VRCAGQPRLLSRSAVCDVHETQLAEASALPHVSSDVTRKRLAGIAPDQRADPSVYRDELNRLTYAELGRRAAREVKPCGGAIIDAKCRHRADREAFAQVFSGAAPASTRRPRAAASSALCVSACPVASTSQDCVGPAALATAERLLEEPRGADPDDVLWWAGNSECAWHCHIGMECSGVCPVDATPAERIMALRRRLTFGRHARKERSNA